MNLAPEFDNSMEDDSKEALSDDEMRERMAAQVAVKPQEDNSVEQGPSMAAAPEDEATAPAEAPQPRIMCLAGFARERTFTTETLDTKLTIVEHRLANDIKNESIKRQELADNVEMQMNQIMDRIKKLEVQERGAPPTMQGEWQPNHVILAAGTTASATARG